MFLYIYLIIGGIVIDPYLIGLNIDWLIIIGGVGNKSMLGIGSIANSSGSKATFRVSSEEATRSVSPLPNDSLFQLNNNNKIMNKNNNPRCINF
jgi:hypothetical protein